MNASSPAITDFSRFAGLRAGAAGNDPAVLREVAGQFEALFLETLFKAMRAGQLAEPLFGSDQHETYLGMLDQQLALEMARGKGLGFGELLVDQLGGGAERQPAPPVDYIAPAAAAPRPAAQEPAWSEPLDFVRDLWPHAERIGARLKVLPEAVLAQAALETGWGQNVPRRSDGSSSNNLFGIKAGRDWHGGSIVRATIEFVGGIAEQVKARFRAYPDIAAAFDDFAALIETSPRYAGVRERGGDTAAYAQALQDAGYATDPQYAVKIRGVAASDTMRRAVDALKTDAAVPITSTDAPPAAR